jgi:hypothetical protein
MVKEAEPYDKAACNKYIAEAFVALINTQNVNEAVTRIAAVKVPEALQAEQLCDLLSFIVEAGADVVRKLGFQLIVAIYTEGCWSQESLVKGLQSFVSLCAAKVVDAPDLQNVLCSEMVVAFKPLFERSLLTPLFERGLVPADSLRQALESPEAAEFTEDTSRRNEMSQDDGCSRQVDQPKRLATQAKTRAKNSNKKKSLIDIAAQKQQRETQQQEELWGSCPQVYIVPSVYYYAEPWYWEAENC